MLKCTKRYSSRAPKEYGQKYFTDFTKEDYKLFQAPFGVSVQGFREDKLQTFDPPGGFPEWALKDYEVVSTDGTSLEFSEYLLKKALKSKKLASKHSRDSKSQSIIRNPEGKAIEFRGKGSRSRAKATARLTEGEGLITVNDKYYVQYFQRPMHRGEITEPFLVTGTVGMYDVSVRAHGGGLSGQSGAVKLAIAKCLALADPTLVPMLERSKMLDVDIRQKERKRYGKYKARKAYPFLKR